MVIRQEKPSDYEEVYQLVKTSFQAVCPDGTEPDEQDYLNKLREKDVFIPALSLVAEHNNGTLVGQIVLYKTIVSTPQGEQTELLLSPLCVHPDYVRRGIARQMIEKAMGIAKEMGFQAVFLCGEPEIYGRMGFVPSYRYGIFHKEDASKSADWSMVRELYRGALDGVSGVVDTI